MRAEPPPPAVRLAPVADISPPNYRDVEAAVAAELARRLLPTGDPPLPDADVKKRLMWFGVATAADIRDDWFPRIDGLSAAGVRALREWRQAVEAEIRAGLGALHASTAFG